MFISCFVVVNVMYMHIILCILIISLNKLLGLGLKLLYDDTLGLIDCYPSNSCALVIAHEADLVGDSELQVKVQKLTKVITF